jgi:hypothetical protein
MEKTHGAAWKNLKIVCLMLASVTGCAGSAAADDTEVLHQKFKEIQQAVKIKDAEQLWNLVSIKTQKDADKIGKEVRETYGKASSEEKRKQEQTLGLSAADFQELAGKGFVKSAGIWKKYHDLPGSSITRVTIAGDSATVNYLETDGDREKMLFLREGNEWKAWLVLPRPTNVKVLDASGKIDKQN